LAAAIRETVLSLPETKQSRLPRIKISGCPNSCGHHPIAELGFSGSARRVEGHLMPFYAVIRFPKNSEGNALGTKLGEIPAKAIPEFVRQLESLDTVQETLKKFQKIPTYEEAPDYYRDWGQTTDFSLAGRGPGECGAGVLDVIELDLKSAEADLQFAGESKKLYAAALSAMRALLVIRGVGAQVPREIFDAFRKHLIAPGWVEVDSEKVIEALLDYKLGDLSTLAHKEASIRALVARIRELYQSLDANLNFRVKAYTVVSPNLETGAAPAGSHRLDLRGTPCPMNFVLAKLELEKIPVGESLEVYLDEGDPIKNVPASFKDQGQDVAALGEAPGQGKSVTIRRKV
jgi:sulfite reductase (ferredoxin)